MPRGAVPFPFGNCRVCNAPATGNHYGANTCEGCKGFFKRSLGKSDKYKCLNNEKCAIDPDNRIKCKLCRFNRCLKLGMSMDAIKMGRIPKKQKQNALNGERDALETRDLVYRDSQNMYRNTCHQSSPPSQQEMKPPRCKQLKRTDSSSSSSVSMPGGQARIDSSGGSLTVNTFDTSCPTEAMPGMETADMVQLLHEAISIEGPHSEESIYERQPATSCYARTLASAAHSINMSYSNWQSMQSPPSNGINVSKLSDKHHSVSNQNYLHSQPEYQLHENTSTYGYTSSENHGQHALDEYLQSSHFQGADYKVTNSHDSLGDTTILQTDSLLEAAYPSSGSIANDRIYSDNGNPQTYYSASQPENLGSPSQDSYEYVSHHSQEHEADYGSSGSDINASQGERESFSSISGDSDEALIESITNAYSQLTTDIREGIDVMEHIIATGSTEKFLPLSRDNLPILWEWLMDSVVYYNNMMTKFCMMCPLISSLSYEDKKALIQHAYISMWLVWNSPLFKAGQSYIPFQTSSDYVYSRNWMEKILPEHFVAYLHEYADRQNASRFNVREIALLSCLSLTSKNVTGITAHRAVNQMHETFKNLLIKEINKNRVNPKEMLNEIPHLLQFLEIAVVKQKIILEFDQHKPPNIEFS